MQLAESLENLNHRDFYQRKQGLSKNRWALQLPDERFTCEADSTLQLFCRPSLPRQHALCSIIVKSH